MTLCFGSTAYHVVYLQYVQCRPNVTQQSASL